MYDNSESKVIVYTSGIYVELTETIKSLDVTLLQSLSACRRCFYQQRAAFFAFLYFTAFILQNIELAREPKAACSGRLT
jgi:hypothetical protein